MSQINVDVLRKYVFTFKSNKNIHGDFDHVLVKYRLWNYDDPDEWKIIPISRGHCQTPKGEYVFDDNLDRVFNLGTQYVKKGLFGGYKSADIDRLGAMADRL